MHAAHRLRAGELCGTIPGVQVATFLVAVSVIVSCAVASGCDANAEPTVSKADLQTDISNRLAESGVVPQSVNCPDDLIGEVGRSARCAVTIISSTSGIDSFESLVTVTSVDGTDVNYDVVPTETKTQLEAAVAQQLAQSYRVKVSSVACESGLDGKVGASTHCAVTTDGVTLRRTIEVTGVTGFKMNYYVVPVVTKEAAARSLLAQLGNVGPRPDSASCVDNLDGKPGNTVECTAVTQGRPETFILTVTNVSANNVAFSYARKP